MGRPTEGQLAAALAEAARMREQGLDEHFLARSLLNLDYRMKFMEDVLHKANLFLHSGQGAHEHAELVRAIERAERANAAAGGSDDDIHPW